jgi:diaminohydroxyphosphoribosylaminopyrimidine deaminase/5-amino-6-(5-phosphoribosylamino)uracil reductase
MITELDEKFMQQAIECAAAVDPAETNPNPRVGCVIVESGIIVAQGAHRSDGGAHAEVEAIAALGERTLSEATLYVTLEPCSTPGRTGACCDRIRETSGIRRVVIGVIDPNPAHRGGAISLLASAGLQVDTGCLSKICAALNPEFHQRMEEAS